MSLPSASVLSTSIVCPDIEVTISPGLVAMPLGKFSQAGIMLITFNGNPISATAWRIPIAAAPPHMSNFISSILCPGFMDIPPESKVTPLPTITIGF